MRSGTRKFITAAAVTMALGAGLGTASSAVAAEPATAHTHSAPATNQSGGIVHPAYRSQWYYKGTYDNLYKCKAAAVPYLYFGYSDYACTTTADMSHYQLWVVKVWLD